MTKTEIVMEWWNNLSSAQKTHICDTHTELIGRNRRHETVDDTEKELLFDYKCNSDAEIIEMVFSNESNNKGT
jgi:hypothetical protein